MLDTKRVIFNKPDTLLMSRQGRNLVDMHTHTKYSDSLTKVKNLLKIPLGNVAVVKLNDCLAYICSCGLVWIGRKLAELVTRVQIPAGAPCNGNNILLNSCCKLHITKYKSLKYSYAYYILE